jgi:hypothetical protein
MPTGDFLRALPVPLAFGIDVRVRRFSTWFLTVVAGAVWWSRSRIADRVEHAEGSYGFGAYRSDERRLIMDIAALFNWRRQHAAKSPRAFERRYRVATDVVIQEPKSSRSTVEKNKRMTFTPERDRKLERELARERAGETSET